MEKQYIQKIDKDFIEFIHSNLYEDFGIFQIKNKEINQSLKEIVDIIYDDILTKKYTNYKVNSKKFIDITGDNSIEDVYKLSYKSPLDWILRLDIYIIITKSQGITGATLQDDDIFSIYGNNKILHSGICIFNPEENDLICNTIYHELKHLYRASIIYKNKGEIQDKDIIICNNTKHNVNFDITNYNQIINNIKRGDIIGYDAYKNFLFECLYFLNDEELYAHLENLYSELSTVNELSKSKTFRIYNSIRNVLKYCIENEIFLPGDEFKNILKQRYFEYIEKDINKFKKAFKDNNIHHNYKFIFKKFEKKINYFFKHVNKIYTFLVL